MFSRISGFWWVFTGAIVIFATVGLYLWDDRRETQEKIWRTAAHVDRNFRAIEKIQRTEADDVTRKVKEELRPEVGEALADFHARLRREREGYLKQLDERIREANLRAGVAQDKASRVDKRAEIRLKHHEKESNR